MGYFVLEAVLFVAGLLAFVIGYVPMTRRRRVRAAGARVVGVLLMIPLPLYLVACKRSNVDPLGLERDVTDPFMPHTEGFVRLAAVMAAFACVLAATVVALVTSEVRPRKDKTPPTERSERSETG